MAVDTDELRDMANDCAEDGLHTVAEQLRADADEIDRLRNAIEFHRASSRLASLNDLPRSEFDSLLWSVLDEGEE